MAAQDIILAPQIDAVKKGSQLSLAGGGALLTLLLVLLYQENQSHPWKGITTGMHMLVIAGAIALGLLSGLLKGFDAWLRYRLSDALIKKWGTTDMDKIEVLLGNYQNNPIGQLDFMEQDSDGEPTGRMFVGRPRS